MWDARDTLRWWTMCHVSALICVPLDIYWNWRMIAGFCNIRNRFKYNQGRLTNLPTNIIIVKIWLSFFYLETIVSSCLNFFHWEKNSDHVSLEMYLGFLSHRAHTNIKCHHKNKAMINKAKIVVFLKSIISYNAVLTRNPFITISYQEYSRLLRETILSLLHPYWNYIPSSWKMSKKWKINDWSLFKSHFNLSICSLTMSGKKFLILIEWAVTWPIWKICLVSTFFYNSRQLTNEQLWVNNFFETLWPDLWA